jgi:hypothetical protein
VNTFDPNDLACFEPEAKVGLVATLSPDGRPHLTLLTSLMAPRTDQLAFGQFSHGRSKQNVRTNPQTGFLIMTRDRKLWRGKARWTHQRTEGPEYEAFNQKPMFRYNAYMGIHTAHYLDLVDTKGREALPLAAIGLGLLMGRLAARPQPDGLPALKPWAKGLFQRVGSLKFLARVDSDGFPWITPVLPLTAPDSGHLVFPAMGYGRELARLTEGEPVAVLGLTFQMESVLAGGRFEGFGASRGIRMGRIRLEWVYNSMPPKQGPIYPPQPLAAVTRFS